MPRNKARKTIKRRSRQREEPKQLDRFVARRRGVSWYVVDTYKPHAKHETALTARTADERARVLNAQFKHETAEIDAAAQRERWQRAIAHTGGLRA